MTTSRPSKTAAMVDLCLNCLTRVISTSMAVTLHCTEPQFYQLGPAGGCLAGQDQVLLAPAVFLVIECWSHQALTFRDLRLKLLGKVAAEEDDGILNAAHVQQEPARRAYSHCARVRPPAPQTAARHTSSVTASAGPLPPVSSAPNTR